jgi:hypothetical protein
MLLNGTGSSAHAAEASSVVVRLERDRLLAFPAITIELLAGPRLALGHAVLIFYADVDLSACSAAADGHAVKYLIPLGKAGIIHCSYSCRDHQGCPVICTRTAARARACCWALVKTTYQKTVLLCDYW